MRYCFFTLLVLFLASCAETTVESTESIQVQFKGETMGTYYSVSYLAADSTSYKKELDSMLLVINDEVSTYIPTSTISTFNQSEEGMDIGVNYQEEMFSSQSDGTWPANMHFARNYVLSDQIQKQSGGAFDPTVMPLVNYWGFGYTEKKAVTAVDSMKVDSLQEFVGFEHVSYQGSQIKKSSPGVQLDFSAVAKGYAVDELGRFLEMQGITDYLIEIGGEVRARGLSARGDFWRIGINTPTEDATVTDYQLLVNLKDISLATSGNYRNYYDVEGVKYAHTINPKTGYPERSSLLSASVFAKDCGTADGLATSFMVMGLEAAKALLPSLNGVEACLIYGTADGGMDVYMTPGIEQFVEQAPKSN
ncbi:MAG: FAD:protein FMN transferase [Bacteroidetes bacterium]|nr:FAD:protein FMN transferase [Bacteroidota bacterium]